MTSFTPADRRASSRVLVIGAGMAGILMGIRLKRAGFSDFTIVDKADRPGGTWRDNVYPGLHCDTPSHHYCYTFEPYAGWTHLFSSGPQIWAYLERTARKYGLNPHIRFGTTVTSAEWSGTCWRVALDDGGSVEADILVAATGFLREPFVPNFPGLETFEGPVFHTSRWDRSLDLADKRVGLVGTGSTAVQIICALSGAVRKLVVFQRTAQWVVHVPNPPIPWWKRALYRLLPSRMRRLYGELETLLETQTDGAVMGHDKEARAELERNVEANLASVRDPVLLQKLTPDHKVGCKRLIISPSFYQAVQHPTVDVVIERIERIEPRGIVTADGVLHELDVIALATGFDPLAYVRPMKMTGVEGYTLDAVWAERPLAYHSMAVPFMPNFFMLEGPFTPISNFSLFQVAEWQANYIMKCVETIDRDTILMMPRHDVTTELTGRYREDARQTIWATGGCKSWYQDKDGIPIVYPYTHAQFREEMAREPDLGDFTVRSLAS